MATEIKIQNRIENNVVYSNLVYPLDYGYYYVAPLDNKWVEDRIHSWFGVDRIANKYAVEIIGNSGHPLLICNHDGDHYLVQKGKIKEEKFVLNGDMANEFNDSFPSEYDCWDGDETDKINY